MFPATPCPIGDGLTIRCVWKTAYRACDGASRPFHVHFVPTLASMLYLITSSAPAAMNAIWRGRARRLCSALAAEDRPAGSFCEYGRRNPRLPIVIDAIE
jgi:hypothetical protein